MIGYFWYMACWQTRVLNGTLSYMLATNDLLGVTGCIMFIPRASFDPDDWG